MIGIFDSGIGGLTVAREVLRQLPGFNVVYLGDTARTPYGNKSPETVVRYALEDAHWLTAHGAKLFIVACNTMSALAAETLRNRFAFPVFDVLRPAVEETTGKSFRKRIGVIGTRATIESRAYHRLIHEINPDAEVFSQACPLFVPLVEEGWFHEPETRRIAKHYLTPLKLKRVDALILGCTHYPLLRDVIHSQIGRNVELVDSAHAVVRQVKDYLDVHPDYADALGKGNRHEWFLTDVAPRYNQIASAWLGRPVHFRQAELAPTPERHVK